MTSFRNKLKDIRSTQTDQIRQRTPLTDEQLGLHDGTERCLHVREELVREIERLMWDFIAEAPSFATHRGFFEGKYSIGLSCDEFCLDERAEPDKYFSRINFLLDPCVAEDRFTIVAKLTVCNRDQAKATTSGALSSDEDMARFRAFLEEQMLRFATKYFARRSPLREVPVPGST